VERPVKALWQRIVRGSVRQLIRAACVLSLLGIAIMSYSILSPRPLPVILAMSVGQAIGGAGFACYLIAIALDAARRRPDTSSFPPIALSERESKPDA
jgi:hypothetical protein